MAETESSRWRFLKRVVTALGALSALALWLGDDLSSYIERSRRT